MTVTRVEIATNLTQLFTGELVTRAEVLAAAIHAGARPEVVATLQRLPDQRFSELRELWPALPEVPIESPAVQ